MPDTKLAESEAKGSAAGYATRAIERLERQLNTVIRGKADQVRLLLVGLFSGGHILIEDVPGTGKTTLMKALARCMNVSFQRIQFTPDLLPTDIIGGAVYSPRDGDFHLRKGPVFTHVLLADEINRASPRTQSALLEAMSENQVTIDNETHKLPPPFVVVATQNPVEQNGTYPLPDAQLDRFCMKLALGYPDRADEQDVFRMQTAGHPVDRVEPVISAGEVLATQEYVGTVDVEDSVLDYISEIVIRTRTHDDVELGASPRGLLDLGRTSQALAALDGRDCVVPDDVRRLAIPVLAHRLHLHLKAVHSGTTPELVIESIVQTIHPPV
jgi:MoxR-like ATPase